MKRTRRVVVAMAFVLVLGSNAEAALVTIDAPGKLGSGSRGGAVPSGSAQSLPTDRPCGVPRPGSPVPESDAGCRGDGFSTGSSLAIDVPRRVAIMQGRAVEVGSLNRTTPIASRPTGALTGRRIAWMGQGRAWSGRVNLTGSSAARCPEGDCARISVTDEALSPLQPTWAALTDETPLPAIFLGSWLVNSDGDSFAAGATPAGARSIVDGDASPRSCGTALTRSLRWIASPEAVIPALLALGIGGLAARLRRGGSR
jgi:hypothetical protein